MIFAGKLLRKAAVPLLCLIVLAGVVAAGAGLVPDFSVPLLPGFSLGSRTTTADSQIILREVRPILSVSTVEYTYKSVFPYDFFPEDTDFTQLRALDFSGREPPSDLEEEMELYRLCREVGMEVGHGSYDFAVITTRVKAGFDLSGSPWGTDATGQKAGAGTGELPRKLPVRVVTDEGTGRRTVTITLPPPVITEFIIRDETSEEYEYPDIDLTASEWKRITGFVAERVRRRVEEEKVASRAGERGRRLIRSFLLEAGWDEVRYETAAGS